MNRLIRSSRFNVLSVLTVSGMGILSYSVINDSNEISVSQSFYPETITENSMALKASTVQQGNLQLLPGVEKMEEGFDFDDSMKLKLRKVSAAYEEQAKYPSFSIPINPEELKSKYLPDISVANDLPANLRDPESPTLSIETNKLRYFYGDRLTATVQISGLSENENSAVSARLVSDGDVLARATVYRAEEGAHIYELDFSELRFDDVDWKQEFTVDTEFQFLGQSYQRGKSIEYLATIARVEDVSPSEVQEDYLFIPVHISTEKPGYHRLRANLYESDSGNPLLHLRAEEIINGSSGTLTLKAHVTALIEAGSEGPYELRDISLQRLPSKPDYITEFGRVDQSAFGVDGYSFSEYQDKPYVNEKAKRIASELRRLGS